MSLEWNRPEWLLAALLLPFGVMLAAHFLEAKKRQLAQSFASAERQSFTLPSRARRLLKWACLALCLGLLCVCLADPRFGVELREISHQGRDIVFVLDVSKSMLARDTTPSRLKRAKLDIQDSVASIRGHRLGLIVFAGKPKELCPLSYDYHHFLRRLAKCGPDDVPVGGTNIGDALRKAVDLIHSGARLGNFKDIVLITDGQDLEGFYEEAAKKAGEAGISIYTVGIGSETGSPIILDDGQLLKHKGEVVQARLDAAPLQEISTYSDGGFYRNLAHSPDWMKQILKHIEAKQQAKLVTEKHERKIPRYPWPLALALFLFGLQTLISERPKESE